MAHVVAALAHDTTVTAGLSQLSTFRHLAGGFVEGCVVSLLFLPCIRVIPVILGGLFRVGRFTGSHYHFTLLAQYAADILPLAMFAAWRALNDSRRLR